MDKRADFRDARHRLPPEAFAVGGDEPDPPPSDLVQEDTWGSLVGLPDHVSIRTSDSHGTELKVMHDLWGALIESVGEKEDAIWYALPDAGDEFQACWFNSLCGFYRVAASCLRSALDVSTIGTFLQVTGRQNELHDWLEGKMELSFGQACDSLHTHPHVRPLEDYLTKNASSSIFEQKHGNVARGGWIRYLYSRLSDFTHSRPTHKAPSYAVR